MIKGVIFDLDNTLVDFMRMKYRSVDAAIDAMIDTDLQLSRDEAREKVFEIYDKKGIEYQNVFDMLLEAELGEVDPRCLAAGITAYRRTREAELVLYPHVNETLIALIKRGLKLAVVTDAPRLQAWLRLYSLNLHHVFDHVVTFEDTGVRKPDPAPFCLALERLGLRPEEVVMVGDWAERDMAGAAQVGMVTAFARYGDTFDTQEPGADYELADISDLLNIIDRHQC